MLSNLSLPWWAYALMGTGLCVFIALIAITIHRNRGMHRSLFASPYALWMMIFTIVPVILIAYYAFTDSAAQTVRLSDATEEIDALAFYRSNATVEVPEGSELYNTLRLNNIKVSTYGGGAAHTEVTDTGAEDVAAEK